MSRITLFAIVIILIACSSKENKKAIHGEQESDSSKNMNISLIPIEDFDDLVKKWEDPERVNWQNPEKVFEKMGNLAGKIVADIGIGTGYFAFRLVRKGAYVIGIDIEEKFIEYIEDRKSDLPEELSNRIITRLTVPDEPNLKPNEVDWVLIVNTFYILDNRRSYLRKVLQGLKSGGRLIIVDYKMGNMPVGPLEDEKITINQATTEIQNAGFKIIETDELSLQYQYIIVAEK